MPVLDDIIKKSIEISLEIFSPTRKQNNYHFSFAFHGRKLLNIGQNDPINMNAKAMKIAKLFNNYQFQNFPYLHSETDLIGRLWSKIHVDRKITIVNIRLNRLGYLKNSKPCKNCKKILEALDVEDVIWSTSQQSFKGLKIDEFSVT